MEGSLRNGRAPASDIESTYSTEEIICLFFFFFCYSSVSMWSQPQTLLTNDNLLRVVGTVTNRPKHQIKECSFSLSSEWLLTYRNANLVLSELPVFLFFFLVLIFRSLKFACFFSEMSHRHKQTYVQLITKLVCHTDVGQTKL